MKDKKRLYIYKVRDAKYRKGYTWLLKVVVRDEKGKLTPVLLSTSYNLKELVKYRNDHLKRFYPFHWKKVLRHEGLAPLPKPKVAYNYNLLPIGSSPIQTKEK